MTNSDLINKIASQHSLTSGRSEMIISIVVERITERLKTFGNVKIEGFGEFKIFRNTPSEKILNEKLLANNRIVFEPGREFLDIINVN